MSTEFPHFYNALDWTLQYYSTYRIKDEIERLSGKGYGGANYKTVENSYDLVFTLQERMEAEIINTIQNCYPAAQLIHLSLFKDWLGDYRISKTNTYKVISEITTYNDNLYEKFLAETLKKEEEFKSKDVYQLEHGEKYEEKQPSSTNLLATAAFMHGLTGINHPVNLRDRTITVTNNKFFCLDRTPEYIDPEHFEAYCERLHKMISNFRRILKKYVDMWDEGKLPITHTTVIVQQKEEIQIAATLPEPLAKPTKKLKVNLSVEQLAYLFRLMKDEKLIEAESNIEIQDFISKNFETHRVGKTKNISTKKLASAFSTPEKATAKSLMPILKKMWDKAANV